MKDLSVAKAEGIPDTLRESQILLLSIELHEQYE